MRLYPLIILLTLNLDLSVTASPAAKQRGGIDTRESIISATLPQEYAEFSREKTSGNARIKIDGLLKLLGESKDHWRSSKARVTYDPRLTDTHVAVWKLLLTARNEITDPASKEQILNQWNENLRNATSEIPMQLVAATLSGAWSRELLSNSFWELLQRTEEPRTLSAICYLLYRKGELQDLPMIVSKRNSVTSVELRSITQKAINWITYKHKYSNNPANPGPAEDPPTIEID